MKKTDMKIFKIQFNEINGGSIRCYVTHSSNQNYDNKNNLNVIKKNPEKRN